ncbi:hypothetical protein CRYUN_Cryun04dG0164100 [Craigia yunnanensis]
MFSQLFDVLVEANDAQDTKHDVAKGIVNFTFQFNIVNHPNQNGNGCASILIAKLSILLSKSLYGCCETFILEDKDVLKSGVPCRFLLQSSSSSFGCHQLLYLFLCVYVSILGGDIERSGPGWQQLANPNMLTNKSLATVGPLRDGSHQSGFVPSVGASKATYLSNAYSPEARFYHEAHKQGSFLPHFNSEDLKNGSHGIYNETASLGFHSFGHSPQMPHRPYAPVSSHLPPVGDPSMFPNARNFPTSDSSYHQPSVPLNIPHVTSKAQFSHLEFPVNIDQQVDGKRFGLRPNYVPQLGSYDGASNFFGLWQALLLVPRGYTGSQSDQSSGYGNISTSSIGINGQIWPTFDEARQGGSCNTFHAVVLGLPSAFKPKSQITTKGFIIDSSKNGTTNGITYGSYNRQNFVTDYQGAKFFVIKSYSEDNVHKSIKYGVWSSTPISNKNLDTAYHEAIAKQWTFPVFLLFSVNASAQLCGVAEMVGPVDFDKSVYYWLQDKWSGQFPVKWHIIKDVPNSQFRLILLESNDNKPVTNSRDTQEVRIHLRLTLYF